MPTVDRTQQVQIKTNRRELGLRDVDEIVRYFVSLQQLFDCLEFLFRRHRACNRRVINGDGGCGGHVGFVTDLQCSSDAARPWHTRPREI